MEIFNESKAQKDKFRSAANKLLNHCFIVKKKEDLRNDYVFIQQNKAFFEEYFDLLGYELIINENSGVIGISNYNGSGRLRLKKIETILLLILRLIYIEKKKELGLSDDVITLSSEIHEKYNMLKIESKLNIDKTVLKDTMTLFKRYNLILNIDRDVTLSDARILIYPSILFAVSGDNVNSVYESVKEKLNKFNDVGEIEQDEETDQD